MTSLCCDVLNKLAGKTLVTAESLTGGGIGAALTAIAGSSSVYKGGVICYMDQVKEQVLQVPKDVLRNDGAVSAPVAGYMAGGVRRFLQADYAISVTGLAGPSGDAFGNEVGTVYISFESESKAVTKKFLFSGDRDAVRKQTIQAALQMVLELS